ncbi:MAG: lipase family alpha/beta hydrolase [Thermodesulfovibrionales bacterium]
MTVHEGDRNKPLVILIHGLGMDQNIWTDPCAARILGGALPITVLLSERPEQRAPGSSKITGGERPDPKDLRTIFHDLRDRGYPLIAWSQQRPAGPIAAAASELAMVMEQAVKTHPGDIILVCHSRGGLIARKFLKEHHQKVAALITLCTPHKGSSIARLAAYITPLVKVAAPFLSDTMKSPTLKKAVVRVTDFIKSNAVRELLPESGFFQTLADKKEEGMRYLTLGGTNPSLFGLYRWKELTAGGTRQNSPEEVLSFPGIFEKIIPSALFPDELKKGSGDGLVTAGSSRLAWSDEHHDFPLNHARMLYDKRVRQTVITFLEENF